MRSSRSKRNKPPPGRLPLASVLDSIGDAIIILDADWNFFYVNQAAADFGGKRAQDVLGKNVWEEFSEQVGLPFEDACRRAMRQQVPVNLEFYYSPGAKWFDIHLRPVPQSLTIYATDITRRVLAEARLSHQVKFDSLNARLRQTNEALTLSTVHQHELTEKAELLNARLRRAMQESHHRIKNNFQVVSSLMEMQIGESGDTACDDHLRSLQQHIRALTNIHDLLTRQPQETVESDTLGTQAVLGWLIALLQETSGGQSIRAQIADLLLPMPKAVSLSLLVSECVSNAIKHSSGEIEVTFQVEGGQACLEVCDDGTGFAPDFDWRKAANTGLSLIDATARHDLRGEVRYETRPAGGGRVIITFPVPAITQSGESAAIEVATS